MTAEVRSRQARPGCALALEGRRRPGMAGTVAVMGRSTDELSRQMFNIRSTTKGDRP
jgi:hypothetical protein